MSDEPVEGVTEELVTGVGHMPTARVADSYGDNPHEHKPSQDVWEADTADEKQAGTGGAEWPGSSSSTSPTSKPSSDAKKTSAGSKPAPTTASRTEKDPTDSSSARSTATGRASGSGSASK